MDENLFDSVNPECSDADITIIEPWTAIRQRPHLFAGTSSPTPQLLATLLVRDILASGITSVSVEVKEDWWIIATNADWIYPAKSVEMLHTVIPFHEAGVNRFHSEVIVAALCTDVTTIDGQTTNVIKGECCSIVTAPRDGRLVAFRL